MKRETKNTLLLGVFVIAAVVIFILTVYLIGNRKNLFGSTLEISAVFRNVNGLQNGSNVRYSGINVGTVKQIDLMSDSSLRVIMVIDEKVREFIKKDAIASIGSDGLVGNMLVNLSPGPGNVLPVENRDEIVSYSRIETEDMLSTLGVTNENIALLSRDLLQITESINNGSGTFTMLLHDESLAYTLKKSIENLENSTENLSLAIDKIYLLLDDVDSGRGLLGKLWNDTSAFNQLEFLVSNRLAEILNNTDSVVADMDLVLKELLISGENMRYISSDLRNVVRALRHGDGTAGLLLRDSTLALQLEMIIQNLVDGTEKFDENMKALRENILLRRYFRRQEKEARKNPEE